MKKVVNFNLFDIKPPKFKVVFTDETGGFLGELVETDDKKLAFVGDVEESAKLFFDNVIKRNLSFVRNSQKEKRFKKNTLEKHDKYDLLKSVSGSQLKDCEKVKNQYIGKKCD